MKKRVIKDFRNLPENMRESIRNAYPQGYSHHLITFFDKEKHVISALPYETDDISYLIKMPASMHLEEEEEESMDQVPSGEHLDDLDEEKYLIQEEEEEESD